MSVEKPELAWERKKTMLPNAGGYLKFIIPSLLGVLLFLTPVFYRGKWTIGVGILAETVQRMTEPVLPAGMTVLLWISFLTAL